MDTPLAEKQGPLTRLSNQKSGTMKYKIQEKGSLVGSLADIAGTGLHFTAVVSLRVWLHWLALITHDQSLAKDEIKAGYESVDVHVPVRKVCSLCFNPYQVSSPKHMKSKDECPFRACNRASGAGSML